MHRALSVLAALTLAVACNKSDGADVIKKHRAAVEEALEGAKEIHAKARKEPPVDSGDGLPDSAPEFNTTTETIAAEMIEELARLDDDDAKAPPMDLDFTGRLSGCAKILRAKDTSRAAAAEVERCAKAKYVLVVRIRDYQAPEKASGKTFTPGNVTGDALLYRLKGAKKLGGFTFEATSSAKVAVAKSATEFDLRQDLSRAVGRALSSGSKATKDDDEE